MEKVSGCDKHWGRYWYSVQMLMCTIKGVVYGDHGIKSGARKVIMEASETRPSAARVNPIVAHKKVFKSN